MITIRTNGTIHGTPRIGISSPRLELQISTSTMPHTATAPIVSSETLIGGAVRPLERRLRTL